MVHALHEAQRVLKPNGILFDLRPAAVHRRVGIIRAGDQFQLLGVMREKLDDDYIATRAVKQVIQEGLFKFDKRLRFDCNRTMDQLSEFREWVNDFISLNKNLPSHDWLLQRVEQAVAVERGKIKIVISGPLDLRVLTKRIV